jgi:hypothetical protein
MKKFKLSINNIEISIDNIPSIPKITTAEEILKEIREKKYSVSTSKKTIINRIEIN